MRAVPANGEAPPEDLRPDAVTSTDEGVLFSDVSIVGQTCFSYLNMKPEKALERRVAVKNAKYCDLARELDARFVPLVLGFHGGYHQDVASFLAVLAENSLANGLVLTIRQRDALYRNCIEHIARVHQKQAARVLMKFFSSTKYVSAWRRSRAA